MIISFNGSIHKARIARQTELSELISEVDKAYASAPTPELYKQRMLHQAEFDMLSTGQAERAMLKSRHMSYEYGEKPSRGLAYSLRHTSISHVIDQIDSESGLLSDPTDINQQFCNFYSNLYTSEPPTDLSLVDTFFRDLAIPTVDEKLRESLDSPVSLEEITKAIACLQSGKCPGPDGFPTEFYKKCSAKLAPILKAVFDDL